MTRGPSPANDRLGGVAAVGGIGAIDDRDLGAAERGCTAGRDRRGSQATASTPSRAEAGG